MGPLAPSLSILAYHRVLSRADPLLPHEVTSPEFERQLLILAKWFTVLPLSEAVERFRNGTLPVRAACLTFDDGYADNITEALPVLQKVGLPATFFVTTGFLDGGCMWNDVAIEAVRSSRKHVLDARCIGSDLIPISTIQEKRSAVNRLLASLKYLPMEERNARVNMLRTEAQVDCPVDLMMTSSQVRLLQRSGMEIGAHTVHHPILSTLDKQTALLEIQQSKNVLETITGESVRTFAYPNGKPNVDYLAEHVKMVERLSFTAAVTTAMGVTRGERDRYQLPRFTPWEKEPIKFLLRLLQNTFRTRADATQLD